MSTGIEFEVFKNKDLASLFKNIYDNQRTTQSKIELLIDMLKPLITDAGAAAVIVPLIKDYLSETIKNDSHLVKLASIVQRLYATERIADVQSGLNNTMLSDVEKEALLAEAANEIKQLGTEIVDNTKALTRASSDIDDTIKELTDGDNGDMI